MSYYGKSNNCNQEYYNSYNQHNQYNHHNHHNCQPSYCDPACDPTRYIIVQGPRGFQGFQGAQGAQGVQGVQGVQGTQGFQGFQGFQGDVGAQGFQGSQGAQGSQGFQGPQGIDGVQGVQGVQGPTTPGTGALVDFAAVIPDLVAGALPSSGLIPWGHALTDLALPLPLTALNPLQYSLVNGGFLRTAEFGVITVSLLSLTLTAPVTLTATLYVNNAPTTLSASVILPLGIAIFPTSLQGFGGLPVAVPPGAFLSVVLTATGTIVAITGQVSFDFFLS